ncbi:MAG: hypothetical protein RSC40_09630, partial [Clostridia bacterium]
VALVHGCMALHALGLRFTLLHYRYVLADNVVGTPYMVSAQSALGVFAKSHAMAVHSVMVASCY